MLLLIIMLLFSTTIKWQHISQWLWANV